MQNIDLLIIDAAALIQRLAALTETPDHQAMLDIQAQANQLTDSADRAKRDTGIYSLDAREGLHNLNDAHWALAEFLQMRAADAYRAYAARWLASDTHG